MHLQSPPCLKYDLAIHPGEILAFSSVYTKQLVCAQCKHQLLVLTAALAVTKEQSQAISSLTQSSLKVLDFCLLHMV